MSLSVAWISCCPVKGLAIGQVDECDLTEAGIAGDREFFLVDENNRLVGILSQADVAVSAKEKSFGEMVEEISKSPVGPRL